MKSFLVIGVGRYGRHLCKKLYEMGYDVMAVDRNEDCIEPVLPYTFKFNDRRQYKEGFYKINRCK